jgi:ribosomal protein S4
LGPDKSKSDRKKIDRFISFGEQWDNTLCELLDKGLGYSLMKPLLGVGTKTLAKQIIRLGRRSSGGRPLSWAIKPEIRTLKARDGRKISPHELKQRRATNRRKFLEATKANPELSRNQIRVWFAAQYSWLYQHDRPWLNKHLPALRPVRKRKPKTNWAQKDAELAVAVRLEAERLRAVPGRPVIVTRTAITRSLGMVYFSKNPAAKLPLTNAALIAAAETREQFAVRRVRWAASVFQAQGLSPARWRIALLASLGGDVARFPIIRAALDNAVALLKSQMQLNYHEANAA